MNNILEAIFMKLYGLTVKEVVTFFNELAIMLMDYDQQNSNAYSIQNSVVTRVLNKNFPIDDIKAINWNMNLYSFNFKDEYKPLVYVIYRYMAYTKEGNYKIGEVNINIKHTDEENSVITINYPELGEYADYVKSASKLLTPSYVKSRFKKNK